MTRNPVHGNSAKDLRALDVEQHPRGHLGSRLAPSLLPLHCGTLGALNGLEAVQGCRNCETMFYNNTGLPIAAQLPTYLVSVSRSLYIPDIY